MPVIPDMRGQLIPAALMWQKSGGGASVSLGSSTYNQEPCHSIGSSDILSANQALRSKIDNMEQRLNTTEEK